ncbi:hypothetical protein PUMCH_004925 [Australozyma saopauloensis]|uniref:BHLH domain-containing protein n=1 Tax=Australozyma saopauloensis TaxID=291208 RepID=A0AAX4HFY3_9ASCO|nr:hypothetical protein PUMCH_004925 [[Candida] saopauloensis]
MEDYLRDSPIGDPHKMNHREKGRPIDPDVGYQEFDYLHNSNPNPVFDLNVQDTGREANAISANDPYYETFDFLASPNHNNVSPVGGMDPVGGIDFTRNDVTGSDQFGFGVSSHDPLTALDLIISPQPETDNNMFGSAQYFSPNTRSNQFSLLNPIDENAFSNSYHGSAFSPDIQPQGGISIPAPLNMDLYLSPNAFVSPQFNAYDGSYDTLASPYSNSYLNSPPPMNLTQSASIPNPASFTLALLSRALSPPPPQQGLGVSAPTGPSAQSRKTMDLTSSSQNLTQEEKAKRRREFHNAVERRRRDLIKEKIKILGVLVPPSLLTPQVCATQILQKLSQPLSKELKELIEATKVKEIKPNKASILLTSVDYIRHLHYVIEKQRARREEIEATIASYENGSERYDFNADALPTSSASLHQSLGEFNPDEFFSDVLADPTK